MAWMHAAKPTESNFDLFCPFEHLSPEEQLKDYNIAAQAFDFLREGAVNFYSSWIPKLAAQCRITYVSRSGTEPCPECRSADSAHSSPAGRADCYDRHRQ